MDADCLIKLTKAQIKEDVCAAFEIAIPKKVRKEIMVNSSAHPECSIIQRNLDTGLLNETTQIKPTKKGEESVLATYEKGGYDGVASDDKRFIKKLRILNVPFITPAVFILLLVKERHITVDQGFIKLENLSYMISNDETAIVKLKLETLR